MVQTNRESKRKRDKIENNKAILELHAGASSSSISLYNIDFDNEDIACESSRNPSIRREITPPPEQGEEATVKIPSEKHCSNNLVVPEQEGPSTYNIEEVFDSFTFDLHRREVNRKKFKKVKEDDGTMSDIIENEVLFERTIEDLMTVATSSTTLNQANILNISLLNERITEAKSVKKKLQDEIINLKTEVKKRKKSG